jgi:quinoprotein glucose dehydrogenase
LAECSTPQPERGARSWRSTRPPANCSGCTAKTKASAAQAARAKLSGRGLAYWSNGGESRIFYVTIGYRLIALDAKTGIPVPKLRRERRVDLKQGVEFGTGQQIDLVKGQIGLHATPMVAKDEVIVGSAFKRGLPPKLTTTPRAWFAPSMCGPAS